MASKTSSITQTVKQERRGGIETPEIARAANNLLQKQERRGGIETEADPHPSDGDLKKQERRGGIETDRI